MNWIENELQIKPTINKPVLCYCPDWNDEHYVVAAWSGKEWSYDGQLNDAFTDYVVSWALFMEAD